MEIHSLRTRSLGDTSYLLTHQGTGIVVDPQRDIRRILDLLEQTGAEVSHVLDTHVHNDYLTGAPSLARRLGAELVLPAGAATAFAFVPAFHQEDLEAGAGIVIRPLHTPGHTPEHTSYLVLRDGSPEALFSGGSLLVGSAGRTDLLDEAYARSLARLQHQSVQRLAALPPDVGLYPTHGGGSFCTASSAGSETSTIGAERTSNPVLRHRDAESFADAQLTGLLPYPTYYRYMASRNRLGPPAVESLQPPELGSREMAKEIGEQAAVIDARPRTRYAAAHFPGSLNIEAGDAFAPWVGWLVPFGTPVILVTEPQEDAGGLAVELARIGYEVVGVVRDEEILPTTTETRLATIDELAGVLGTEKVLDVRDPSEWERGHLRQTTHRYVPDLLHAEGLEGEVWLVCEGGFRSSIAAGLVERGGGRPVVVTPDGVSKLLERRPDLAADG